MLAHFCACHAKAETKKKLVFCLGCALGFLPCAFTVGATCWGVS
nr:MAG TPA: hypothetical protein [Caudoviricetes sp.]